MSQEKILVNDREAAAMLSMGRSTFREKVRVGLLPAPVYIGGLTRWRVADLLSAVAGLASPPTTASARGAAVGTAHGCTLP